MQSAGSDLAIFLGYARIIASVLRSSNSLQKTVIRCDVIDPSRLSRGVCSRESTLWRSVAGPASNDEINLITNQSIIRTLSSFRLLNRPHVYCVPLNLIYKERSYIS